MRRVKSSATILTFVFTIVLCVGATAMAQGQERVRELFGDPDFARGFQVTSITEDPNFLGELKLPFEGERATEEPPLWGLATHASKYNIAKAKVVSNAKAAAASTPGQLISRTKDESGGATLKLGVMTENEYAAPRKADEHWIHLLLTRDFDVDDRVAFKDLESLVFSCDARVEDVEMTDPNGVKNPDLHTTQASFYFALPNGNADSSDVGDYIWFGVSFYDERYEIQTDYVEVDGDPETIGTGKLIYRLGEQRTIDTFMDGVNPYHGEWVHVEFDLKKLLPDAIKAAHEKGFLLDSEPDDFVVAHFNFGWETPGTYRSDLELKKPKLLATFREGE
ncbi:MAG: hypothetical protein ACOX0A_02790 [Thermoguttaceae bacterium]